MAKKRTSLLGYGKRNQWLEKNGDSKKSRELLLKRRKELRLPVPKEV